MMLCKAREYWKESYRRYVWLALDFWKYIVKALITITMPGPDQNKNKGLLIMQKISLLGTRGGHGRTHNMSPPIFLLLPWALWPWQRIIMLKKMNYSSCPGLWIGQYKDFLFSFTRILDNGNDKFHYITS